MKQNKISIIIKKPVEEVFEFTTNPKNTPLWIHFIDEEASDKFPPSIGTIYKNRMKGSSWNIYKVTEFEINKLFTLQSKDGSYSARYTYRRICENKTELEYFEWMENGELKEPFTKDILLYLKRIMEIKIP